MILIPFERQLDALIMHYAPSCRRVKVQHGMQMQKNALRTC
jgi:hypothetical protein